MGLGISPRRPPTIGGNKLSAHRREEIRIDERHSEKNTAFSALWRLRSGPCATPINPKYSGAVFRSCPPGPNTWMLNVQPLGQFRPHVAFCQPDSHCPAVWHACYIPPRKLPECFDDF